MDFMVLMHELWLLVMLMGCTWKIFVTGVKSRRNAVLVLAVLVALSGILLMYYQNRELSLLDSLWHTVYFAVYLIICSIVVKCAIRPAYISLQKKTVLITGCDTGFGHLLAKRLDTLGIKVFAGCLYKNGEGARILQAQCSDKLVILQLDVTNTSQIEEARKEVDQILMEEEELFAVVNNAGIVYFGEAEFLPMKYYEQLMNVNYFGTIRVTKAFLPLIRASKGHVVNVASLMGSTALYNLSGYCGSKFAVEAFSQILRQEMKKWDVKVSVIEPGPYDTSIGVPERFINDLWDQANPETKRDYGKDYFTAYENAGFPSSPNVDELVDALEDAVLSTNPQRVYRRGYGSFLLPIISMIYPQFYETCESLLRDYTFYTGAIPQRLKSG